MIMYMGHRAKISVSDDYFEAIAELIRKIIYKHSISISNFFVFKVSMGCP